MKQFLTSTTIYLLTILRLSAQPCGPKVTIFDFQFLTHNGDLILLYSDPTGLAYRDKNIYLRYVVISKKGEIKKDSSLRLSWPEWHYDFKSCQASYRNSYIPNYSFYSPVSTCDCEFFIPFGDPKGQVLLGYFLSRDRKYAYEIAINTAGKAKWSLNRLDNLNEKPSLSSIYPFNSDSSKMIYYEYFLKRKHPNIARLTDSTTNLSVTKDTIHLLNASTPLKLYADTLPKNHQDLYGADPSVYRAHYAQQWVLAGERWKVMLEGYLIHQCNKPLITLKEQLIYITVFNNDRESCRGYGRDVHPITYCISISNGSILWKTELGSY